MKKTKKERKRKKKRCQGILRYTRTTISESSEETNIFLFGLVYQAGGRTAFTLTVFVGFAAGLLAPHRKGELFCAQSGNDDIRGGQRCGT